MSHIKKYYKSTCVIQTKSLHVHHIDTNRKNNDLSNLIHLDTKVHSQLHYLKGLFRMAYKAFEMYGKDETEIFSNKYLFKSVFNEVIRRDSTLKDTFDFVDFNYFKNITIRNSATGITNSTHYMNGNERYMYSLYNTLK